MKKILIACITASLSFGFTNNSFASEPSGYAVVDPSTGIVHGIIVADNPDPFNTGGVMPISYMGCPEGCLIVKQSTSDNGGNVSGIHGNNVSYNQNTETFRVTENNSKVSEIIETTQSGSEFTETSINIYTQKVYEFGIQDLKNQEAFEMQEVSPELDTPAKVTAEQESWQCNSNEIICSKYIASSRNKTTLEEINFDQRSSSEEIISEITLRDMRILIDNISKVIAKLQKWIIQSN